MRINVLDQKLSALALAALLPLALPACGDDVTGTPADDDDETESSTTTGDATSDTLPTTMTTTVTPTTGGGESSSSTTTVDPSDTDPEDTDPTVADSSSSTDPTDSSSSTDPGSSSSSSSGGGVECGDGMVGGDEECDGDDLGEGACPAVGEVACNDDCTLDLSACTDQLVVCNMPMSVLDGSTTQAAPSLDVLNVGEDLFVTDVNVTVDVTHPWIGDLGAVLLSPDGVSGAGLVNGACNEEGFADAAARFDDEGMALECAAAAPAIAGDILPLTQLSDLIGISTAGDWTMATWDNFGAEDDGTLNEWCLEFSVSDMDPVMCGDGVAHYGEVCDGMDLNEATCESLDMGFIGGTLACADDCTLDTSGCIAACGNGEINADFDEACDGDDLGGLACTDLPGFGGGTLGCAMDCTLDTTMCEATCGNGVVDDATETCDGDDLDGQTCDDFFGFTGEGLACDAMCGLDFTGCEETDGVEVCSSPALAISDAAPASDTLMVGDAGTIADVNVFVDITHTWIGDVELVVESPEGSTALILDNSCGDDDNANAIFDDEGGALDCNSPAADSGVTGTITPVEVLTVFDGQEMMGDWTITVTDTASGDNGTLNTWCVQLTPEGV